MERQHSVNGRRTMKWKSKRHRRIIKIFEKYVKNGAKKIQFDSNEMGNPSNSGTISAVMLLNVKFITIFRYKNNIYAK